jgi:dihydropteroate synthase
VIGPLRADPGFRWGQRPLVMGVMNLTPDSFSDGGRIAGVEQALRTAGRLLAQGADVLDLGGQSTRPGAEEVGPRRERERLLPALEAIRAAHPQATLSVDTFHAEVAAVALAAGADWINDVHGASDLRDPAMAAVVADGGCPYVLMHSRGDSRSMDGLASYDDVVAEVCAGLHAASAALRAAGVGAEQLLWDPGLGFAKTTHHNLELLARLPELANAGYPLLLGPSRKRFIGAVLHEPRPRARLWGTAAVCALAASQGAAVLRVHDVGPIAQVVRMASAVAGQAPACQQ